MLFRSQVASYTGMCPREDSSAQRRFQGAINKHGNPRVRPALVEASWRLVHYQPTYKPVARWLPVLTNPKTTRSKRKQIIVAIGRQFSVDWWRVRTVLVEASWRLVYYQRTYKPVARWLPVLTNPKTTRSKQIGRAHV